MHIYSKSSCIQKKYLLLVCSKEVKIIKRNIIYFFKNIYELSYFVLLWQYLHSAIYSRSESERINVCRCTILSFIVAIPMGESKRWVFCRSNVLDTKELWRSAYIFIYEKNAEYIKWITSLGNIFAFHTFPLNNTLQVFPKKKLSERTSALYS